MHPYDNGYYQLQLGRLWNTISFKRDFYKNVIGLMTFSYQRREVINDETQFCDPEVLRKMLDGKVSLLEILKIHCWSLSLCYM